MFETFRGSNYTHLEVSEKTKYTSAIYNSEKWLLCGWIPHRENLRKLSQTIKPHVRSRFITSLPRWFDPDKVEIEKNTNGKAKKDNVEKGGGLKMLQFFPLDFSHSCVLYWTRFLGTDIDIILCTWAVYKVYEMGSSGNPGQSWTAFFALDSAMLVLRGKILWAKKSEGIAQWSTTVKFLLVYGDFPRTVLQAMNHSEGHEPLRIISFKVQPILRFENKLEVTSLISDHEYLTLFSIVLPFIRWLRHRRGGRLLHYEWQHNCEWRS